MDKEKDLIMVAVRNGDEELVKDILQKQQINLNFQDNEVFKTVFFLSFLFLFFFFETSFFVSLEWPLFTELLPMVLKKLWKFFLNMELM